MEKEIQQTKYNKNLLLALILLTLFVAVLNQTFLITALPQIMIDFQVDANKAQWVTTIFMLTSGIIVPISAFLIARFSTRQLFLTAVITLLIGTMLAGIASSFTILLIGRLIQAIGAGLIMPLVSNIILQITTNENRGSAMGLLILVICFGPAIGPALAGGIIDYFSWRYLFFGTFPVVLCIFIASYLILKNVTETNKNIKIDVLSVVLSTVAFTGILYGLSLIGTLGWGDITTISWIAIGAISLYFLVRRQLKLSEPMIEFRVFKYKIFSVSAILVSIAFATMFGVETIVPLYTQNVQGTSALVSGLILLPGAALMGAMSPFVGKLTDKMGIKVLILIGFSIVTLSTIPLAIIGFEKTIWMIVIFYSLRMIGTGFLMTPVQTGAMNAIPKHLYRHGVAVYSTLTNIAGSIGISIIVGLYTALAKNTSLSGLDSEKYAITITFLFVTIISGVGLLLALKLKDKSVEVTDSSLQEEVTHTEKLSSFNK
ncbi:DHA2 family efflux MFS transporter permease subunit [Metabacillus schmidteae]|uniref:DHA2 family efflux MFS transporter permease subunit n=1 Tax=Metabacillus schmidteae TaxID=2730405 RepID=UPI00158E6406|nr:DHA2 family efflux MFS transporter permease subunit [Metabacillus schmidteae]